MGLPATATGLYKDETIEPVTAAPAHLDVTAAVLDAVTVPHTELLYARVDLVDSPDGTPLVLECELVEPSLFLGEDDGAAERFAAAIAADLCVRDREVVDWRR